MGGGGGGGGLAEQGLRQDPVILTGSLLKTVTVDLIMRV